MFKQKLAILFLFIIGVLSSVSAQEGELVGLQKKNRKTEMLQRPLILSFSIGSNFNTGGNDYGEWFGSRASVATQFDGRIDLSFARHWGAYLDLGITFFEVQTDDWGENLATAIFDKLFPGISKLKPSVSIGVAYRAERGRWRLMPRAGMGWMSAGYSNSTTTIGEKEYRLEVDRSPLFFTTGASIGYRTSRLCCVLLDINYRCPVQSCKAVYTTTQPDLPPVTETVKSRSWANDLSISLGIQFQFEMKKKRQP